MSVSQHKLNGFNARLSALERTAKRMATELETLQGIIDAQGVTIAAVAESAKGAATRVQEMQDQLNQTIGDLKTHPQAPSLGAQIAALQAQANTLNGVKAGLDAIDAAATPAPQTQSPGTAATGTVQSPPADATATDAVTQSTASGGQYNQKAVELGGEFARINAA